MLCAHDMEGADRATFSSRTGRKRRFAAAIPAGLAGKGLYFQRFDKNQTGDASKITGRITGR